MLRFMHEAQHRYDREARLDLSFAVVEVNQMCTLCVLDLLIRCG
jgi:hypothetical protein